jgi:hypothetical protein
MAGVPKGTEDAKQAAKNGMPLAGGKKHPKKASSKGSRKSSRNY